MMIWCSRNISDYH